MLRIPTSSTPPPSGISAGPITADLLDYTEFAPILLGPAPSFIPPEIGKANPAIDKTVPYPVTVKDLSDRIITAGRIDPDIKSRRQKIPQILVNTANRIVDPMNNPYYSSTLRTSYYLPDFAQDTRRLMPQFISPVAYPRSG